MLHNYYNVLCFQEYPVDLSSKKNGGNDKRERMPSLRIINITRNRCLPLFHIIVLIVLPDCARMRFCALNFPNRVGYIEDGYFT